MRLLPVLSALALLLVAFVGVRAFAQDPSATVPLPEASDLGSGWTILGDDPEDAGFLASGSSWATRDYVGPDGRRALVTVYGVAEGPKAVRDTWERANEYFDALRYSFDADYSRERDLEDVPLIPGCADMRRVDGTEEVFSSIPVGLTLCAADPDLLIVSYVSGEVNDRTGYAAADHLVELVLSRASGVAASPVPFGTPVTQTIVTQETLEECALETDPIHSNWDSSSLTLPLLGFLPTQSQMPQGLVFADEDQRSKREIIAALGGTKEIAQLLDDWGWSGNAFRDFIADETTPSPNGTTFMNISVHRFADDEAAANAMEFFSDQVIFGQGLQEVEAPVIGESARMLVGEPDGVPLAVLYVQQGPIMYRIGGSSSSEESNPTADVLMVGCQLVPARGEVGAEHAASPVAVSIEIGSPTSR